MTTSIRSRLVGALAVTTVLVGASIAFAADAPAVAPAPAPAVAPAPVAHPVAAPAAAAPVVHAAAAPAVKVAPAHAAAKAASPTLASVAAALERARVALSDKKYGEARSVLSSAVVDLNGIRSDAPRAERAKLTSLNRLVKGARVALRHGEHQDAATKVDAALAAIKQFPAAAK